jgi:pimeloyl-ACP methyl ester carboxylesterase
MQKIIINSVATCILLFVLNNAVSGQENADSLRIVSEAFQMIHFPEPEFKEAFVSNPGPEELVDLGFEQPNPSELVNFEMRDGIKIHGNKYAFKSETTIILLHGVLGSSFTFNKMAGLLREKLQAEVIAIDLRGHGQSGGVPGDVSTLNQYAEDLDDIITSVKSENPGQKIILAGHSMGGNGFQ